MGDKSVLVLPGIGMAYGMKLIGDGYDKAYVLFGKYLVLRKNKMQFIFWLKQKYGISMNHATNTANCFKEWADQYM
uniref:Barrier to autointegration factor n=1 Tax=Panagrellus redivivus TaxID=6233 RepID=A0A7E4V6U9_PANRE